jgi:hypothetical protein
MTDQRDVRVVQLPSEKPDEHTHWLQKLYGETCRTRIAIERLVQLVEEANGISRDPVDAIKQYDMVSDLSDDWAGRRDYTAPTTPPDYEP